MNREMGNFLKDWTACAHILLPHDARELASAVSFLLFLCGGQDSPPRCFSPKASKRLRSDMPEPEHSLVRSMLPNYSCR